MERKIGEIFEYNGEWYQCVEGTGCYKCDFHIDENTCGVESPYCTCRSDKKNVIFKKLEMVGEPYRRWLSPFNNIMVQRYRLYGRNVIMPDEPIMLLEPNYKNSVEIEIKQIKEDMEEKEQCGDNRFEVIEKAKKHLLSSTNIESRKEEMKVLDNFLFRCWQMGWLKQYEDAEEKKIQHYDCFFDGKSSKSNLKPFDLKAAKAGKPVCTRDGRKARIVCFDAEGNKPLIILSKINGQEVILRYTEKGQSDNFHSPTPREDDLMMLLEKKEGWVNVYRDCDGTNITKDDNIYSSKDAAIASAQIIDRDNYVATTIIKWEELL